MVHLQDRAVHVMAVLLHAAANFPQMVIGQADRSLPEGELLIALVGEQADIEMGFGELHGDNRVGLIQSIQIATRLRHRCVAMKKPGEGGADGMGIPGRPSVGRTKTMIRAIIGTAAVLAGFVVLEQSVDASTGLAGSCKAAQAYALLQPGHPLLVRATPTPEGVVVGALLSHDISREVSTSKVTMISSQSGWARIALGGADYTAVDGQRQFGWVPADSLAVSSQVDGQVGMFT